VPASSLACESPLDAGPGVPFGHLAGRIGLGHDGAMAEEMGIYRGEVITIMEALADLRADVTAIRDYLFGDDEEEEEQEGDS